MLIIHTYIHIVEVVYNYWKWRASIWILWMCDARHTHINIYLLSSNVFFFSFHLDSKSTYCAKRAEYLYGLSVTNITGIVIVIDAYLCIIHSVMIECRSYVPFVLLHGVTRAAFPWTQCLSTLFFSISHADVQYVLLFCIQYVYVSLARTWIRRNKQTIA